MIILILALAYLIGSIPFGLILTRMAGLGDIRAIGSGNIGATNVLRTGNKKLAALTLLLDGLKGFSATIVCLTLLFISNPDSFGVDNPHTVSWFLGLPILFATLGHIFPIWLNFKGGKGVATFLGCLLAPPFTFVGLLCVGLWVVVFFLFRISSLAALVSFWIGIGASMGLAYVYTITNIEWPGEFATVEYVAAELFFVVILITYRHKGNIRRLLSGTEPRFGKKP